MSRSRSPMVSPDVVAAVSRASLAVGRLDGALRASPDAVARQLQRIAERTPTDTRDDADRDALRLVLARRDGSRDLVDVLVGTDPEQRVVLRCARVTAVADRAEQSARAACRLLDAHHLIVSRRPLGRYGPAMLDLLVEQTVVTVHDGVARLGASPTTVGALLERLVELGIVEETTGKRRGRVFRYSPYLDLFERVISPEASTRQRQNGAMADDEMSIADWVPIVVERLFARSRAERIILFGSHARNEATDDSDIDLLVVLPVEGRKHDVAVRLMSELRDIPASIDVIVVDPREFATEARLPGIVRVAVREGRVYERAA